MPKTLVYCVHGFLGSGLDWFEVHQSLNNLQDRIEIIAPDFFSSQGVKGTAYISQPYSKRIFVGYSWGGRKGLQMLHENSDMFDHYVFISTHPGYDDKALADREQRILNDEKWAHKLQNLSDQDFLNEWNQQEVFKNSTRNANLNVLAGNRDLLQKALREDSLGLQPDFRFLIQNNKNKITWVVGSRDSKFRQVAQTLENDKIIENLTLVEAGHRVLNDNPSSVAGIVTQLI